jgi:hypothetical protein
MRVPRVMLLLVILTVIALGRVAATWGVYSATFDEPAHLAAGMELLDRGVYRYEEMHPPLSRLAIALGPYVDGLRSEGRPGIWLEGNAILNQRSRPERALTLARAGILPFLLLSIALVFLWTRSLAGDTAGLLAALAFTCVPPVLAHSGLATTDAAAMATVAGTAFLMVRWLERPDLANTCWLGVAAGLALLAKMSAVVFLPAAGVAVLLIWLSAGRPVLPYVGSAVAVGAIAWLTLWAGYRFSVGPIYERRDAVAPISERAPAPASAPAAVLKRRLATAGRLPIYPAPEYPRGILELRRENRQGRRNYLLGEVIHDGRWYFFPVALGVKTPIPFLLLALVGGATLIGMAGQRRSAAVPVVAAAAIFATAMTANINIGVRHILPVFPMLAVCAGLGILRLWHWRRLRQAGPVAAVVLTGWLALESARAHPDYLPYFNQLAGARPERVLVDSDLDWGQDLRRLADTLRSLGVDRVSLAYHGKVDLAKQGLPPFTELEPNTPVTGWVAASVYRLQLGFMGGTLDPFAWLRSHTPVARVGHSIFLYYIEPGTQAGS